MAANTVRKKDTEFHKMGENVPYTGHICCLSCFRNCGVCEGGKHDAQNHKNIVHVGNYEKSFGYGSIPYTVLPSPHLFKTKILIQIDTYHFQPVKENVTHPLKWEFKT